MSPYQPEKIKKGLSVYLLLGEDEYPMVERAKALIRALAPPSAQPMGAEIVEGQAENGAGAAAAVRRCLQAVATPDLFGMQKVVWFRDPNYLVANAVGRGREAADAVKELAQRIKDGLPEGHTLIITAAQAAAKSPLLSACQSRGAVENFDLARGARARRSQAAGFAAAEFKRMGMRVAPGPLSVFVEKVGVDSRLIHEEAEKLAVFAGPNADISESDIAEIVCPAREAVSYEFDDAVGNRDLAGALKIFRRLLFQKEEPVRLLLSIWYRLQSLAVIHELISTGVLHVGAAGRNGGVEWSATEESEAQLGEIFASHPFSNPLKMEAWKLGPLARQAQRFTRRELDGFMQTVYNTRRQLMLSRIPKSLTLEILLIKICAAAKREMR